MLKSFRVNNIFFRIVFTVLCAVFFQAHSQTTSSPYSRFGVGEMNPVTSARSLAMGGTEIALDQPGFINYGNPASFSSLWFTTYEGAADFKQYKFKTTTNEHRTNTALVLSYFELAFPLKPQKWAFGFGLSPYSKIGYSIKDANINEQGDRETKTYEGEGGINSFHFNTGIKITKKFSAGVTADYLFGSVDNIRTVTFANPYYTNSSITSSTSVGGFHFKFGVQYRFDSLAISKSDSIVMLEKKITQLEASLERLLDIKDSAVGYEQKNALRQELAMAKFQKDSVVVRRKKSEWRMVLGLVGSPVSNLNGNNSYLVNSFRYFSYANPNLGTLYRDTVVNSSLKGDIRIPLSLGAGVSFVKGTKWIIASDFTYQQWSDFTYFGVDDSLQNSWRVSTGLQYTPNDRAIKAYHKTMHYRIGFHYEKGYLYLNDKNINDIGVSLGLALPIRKGSTYLHFTAEAGRRGTTANDLIEENYMKFTFGFTINDKWFIRPKYD